MKNPEKDFLSKKYDNLHSSKEVERAVDVSDESVEQDKDLRIDTYLERIKRILEKERPGERTGADLLAHKLVEDYILDTSDKDKMEELAHDLYESERQIAIQRGQGDEIVDLENSDVDILEEYRQTLEEKRKIQQETLETWTNFFLKEDGKDYPMWFQYFVIRSLRDMGEFDRDNLRYAHRTDKTVAPFPELNEEALGFVFDALNTQLEVENIQIPKEVENDIVENTELSKEEIALIEDNAPEQVWEKTKKAKLKNKRNEKRKEWLEKDRVHTQAKFIDSEVDSLDKDRFEELSQEMLNRLETNDFAKLYAFAQVEVGGVERLTIEGEWKKYDQGSDPEALKSDLAGKGTGWCTARGSFAADQLEHGDFYVYYSYNEAGEATEPRVAIRQENGNIAEVRGIGKGQSLEPELIDIAQDKYGDMPGSEKYEKASHDMKVMTEIYNKSFEIDKETGEKTYLQPDLSKEELRFLYEVDSSIEGFGHSKDPRINEVVRKRNLKEDLAYALDLRPDEVSITKQEFLKNSSSIQFHYGYLDLRGTKVTKLSEGLRVGGELYLRGSNITKLPEGLHVGGSLYLRGTKIIELPEGLHVGGELYLRGSNITKLPEGLHVGGSLYLQDTNITKLPEGLQVGGGLDLQNTNITELPEELQVGKNIYFISKEKAEKIRQKYPQYADKIRSF